MDLKLGNFILFERDIYEIICGRHFDSRYDEDCYELRNVKTNNTFNYPVLFVNNKCEKIKDELMARVLYGNMTPDEAMNMHKLDKCPEELRPALARRMQRKWI